MTFRTIQRLDLPVRLMATVLRPSTVRQYEHTVRLFMVFLRERYPDIRSASQLRRDPHILGWLEHLWMRRVSFTGKPWCATTGAAQVIRPGRSSSSTADWSGSDHGS